MPRGRRPGRSDGDGALGGIVSLVAPIPLRTSAFTARQSCIRPGHRRRASWWTSWGNRIPVARLGVRHRDHPGRGVSHLRAWRLAAGDAQPGPGTRTGDTEPGHSSETPPDKAVTGHPGARLPRSPDAPAGEADDPVTVMVWVASGA